MKAVPKPKVTTNSGLARPKLTEEDFLEIGEQISEAMEYNNEVEITVYHQKRLETVVGKITSADSQTGYLQLSVNFDSVRININDIVGIK